MSPTYKNKFFHIFAKAKQQDFIHLKGINNILKIENEADFITGKNNRVSINGNNNIVTIGKNVSIEQNEIKIYGNNSKLIIQDGCRIKNSFLWIEDSECQINIGRETSITEAYLGASENTSVVIGEKCFIESHANVRSGDSHSIIDLKSSERINYARDVCIDNFVWLAPRAWILKGVNIGQNCIVSEGSIVTKSIPNNCLVSGVPAEIRRTKVTWEKKQQNCLKSS